MSDHSVKAFTAEKLKKMDIGGRGATDGMTADQKGDSYGKRAAGESDSTRAGFKRGGAVEGAKAKKRLDRPARRSGGKVHKDAAEDRALFRDELKKHDEKVAKDDRVARKSGGRVGKGKTTVNVIIGAKDDTAQQQPQVVPVPVPAPGGGAPPQAPARPPMPPAGAGGLPGGAPGAMPPPMARKRGGRVSGKYLGADLPKDGSRGGEARLQKQKDEMEFSKKNV